MWTQLFKQQRGKDVKDYRSQGVRRLTHFVETRSTVIESSVGRYFTKKPEKVRDTTRQQQLWEVRE